MEPQIDRLNTASKGALKSHLFGGPKEGDRWNDPVLCHKLLEGIIGRKTERQHSVHVGDTFLALARLDHANGALVVVGWRALRRD